MKFSIKDKFIVIISDIRHNFFLRPLNSVDHTAKSMACLKPKLWEIIPSVIMNINFLQVLNIELSHGNLIIPHAGCVKFWLYLKSFLFVLKGILY